MLYVSEVCLYRRLDVSHFTTRSIRTGKLMGTFGQFQLSRPANIIAGACIITGHYFQSYRVSTLLKLILGVMALPLSGRQRFRPLFLIWHYSQLAEAINDSPANVNQALHSSFGGKQTFFFFLFDVFLPVSRPPPQSLTSSLDLEPCL